MVTIIFQLLLHLETFFSSESTAIRYLTIPKFDSEKSVAICEEKINLKVLFSMQLSFFI